MKYVYSFVLVATVLLLSSCGNNNDCPNGVNTTNPNCPNYSPYAYNQPTNPYPTQSPYPYNPQQPNNTYPYPNNQYPYPNTQAPNYGYPCQPGTPYCVNGYYNPPR